MNEKSPRIPVAMTPFLSSHGRGESVSKPPKTSASQLSLLSILQVCDEGFEH